MGISSSKKTENSGVALIVASIVSAVVMVFALMLILASYTLFVTANKQSMESRCRELSVSVNKEIKQELMLVNYNSYEEQCNAAGVENNFWFYVRYNIWQNNTWPYYDGTPGHEMENSAKYFKIDLSEREDYRRVADSVVVTMYWEIDSDNKATETDKSLGILHVNVNVVKGDSSYSVDSVYSLSVVGYDITGGFDVTESLNNQAINPYNNSIVTNEKWMWTPY